MSSPNVSVIISTYNNPRVLELCLLSYTTQSYTDFEVIVADDGSTRETAELVRACQRRATFPVNHVWQPDRGFRKASILNKALRLARGQLIVLSDQDCVASRDLVARHVEGSGPNLMVLGGRRFLGQESTAGVVRQKEIREEVLLSLSKPRHIEDIYNRSLLHYGFWNGSNASVYRERLIQVNGFNEDYVGWGAEDSEIGYRLYKTGCRVKYLGATALVYHLWHPRKGLMCFNRNHYRLLWHRLRDRVQVVAQNGFDDRRSA